MFKPRALGWMLAALTLLASARALPLAAATDPAALSLAQVLALAEQASPALRAAQEREQQADTAVLASTAFYYPHLVAAAATGTGLAGSAGWAPDGVGGVIGSPFVAGPKIGADISASWDLLDVGAILNRSAAKDFKVSASEQVRFERVQVDQAALIAYFQAQRARGQAELWERESGRVERTYRKVQYYESVGRYSEVQLLLLREMLQAARLEQARAREGLRFTLQDLAVTLGEPDASLDVPSPDAGEAPLEAIRAGSLNPLLAYAQAQYAAARRLERSSFSQSLPRVFADASIGDVDKTLVVPDKNYSASIGVALPLFEGFQNDADFQRAKSATREQGQLLADAQLTITHANDRYDDSVALDRLSLDSLASRSKDAERDLKLAEDRYLHLTGPLSDLQQALVNLTEIEAEINDSRTDLLTNLGAQRLFNGGTPVGADAGGR